METTIGAAAGQVWKYLDQNGPTTAAKLKTELKLTTSTVDRAIGWLARESKLAEVKKGKCVMFEAKK